MKVFVVYDDTTVQIDGDDDQAIMMDLVAHFLGIAIHHNDNTIPSEIAALDAISGVEDA
jgi:hypothetical protein